eukprot:g12935.t1 g12935   contig7:497513-498326(-)
MLLLYCYLCLTIQCIFVLSFAPVLTSVARSFDGEKWFGRHLAGRRLLADASLGGADATVDVCIIGAGISGLTAAITTAEESKQHNKHPSILVLEADSDVGGRVRSDYTPDGFTLDRGFAVFIEQYPNSKELLDYDALKLAQFLPGARVKLSGGDQLALVSDPLRRRSDILKAITSPVGTLVDKARLAPLIYTVVTKNVDELFSMERLIH